MADGAIATAFVRIRPDLSGFKQQTTAGVKAGLSGATEEVNAAAQANVAAAAKQIEANRMLAISYKEIAAAAVKGSDEQIAAERLAARVAEENAAAVTASAEKAGVAIESLKGQAIGLGKAFGIAFGIDLAVKFVKNLSEDAAGVQKTQEVVQSQFGKSAEAIKKFADGAGLALGITSHAAFDTAAKLGIVFQNIGIGQKPAAEMTVNLEKLAGSLSAIRGIDPSVALRTLNLAMLGNVRSLKQLGVSVDPVTEKYVAFKLGLISSTKDALSPANKAIAIYTIATQNLAHFQDLAKSHAGDLANVQRALSAEWDHAKETLGAGLLPAFTKVVEVLTTVLPGAVKATQVVFRDLSSEVTAIAGAIKDAIPESLVTRIKSIGAAFQVGGAGGGFGAIIANFKAISPVAKVAVVAIGAVTAALVVMFAAAFPITATVLAVVGLGVAFEEAYKHSARFRDIVGEIGNWLKTKLLPAIQDVLHRASPAIASVEASIAKVLRDIVSDVQQFVRVASAIWSSWGGVIKQVVSSQFGLVLTTIQNYFKIIGGFFDTFTDVIHGKWGKAWGDLKGIAKTELNQVSAVFDTFASDIEDVFTALWQKVEVITLEGIKKLIGALNTLSGANALGGLFSAVGIHFNPGKDAENYVQGLIDGINRANAGKQIADAITASTSAALQAKTLDPSSDLQTAAAAVGASIAASATAGAAGTSGASLAQSAAAQAAQQAAEAAQAKLAKAQQTAQSAFQTAQQSVASARETIANLKTSLVTAIATEVTDVRTAVEDAKSNLSSIGSSLATSLGTIFDQPFVIAGNKIQVATDRISVMFDAKQQKLAAQANAISRTQALIGLSNDKLNLDQLRSSVLLSGGRSLSQDPTKALAQLKNLLKGNRPDKAAIQQFINQFESANLQVKSDKNGIASQSLDAKKTALTNVLQLKNDLLAVEQDTSNKLKTKVTQQISDLTDSFNRHLITYAQFKQGINNIIGKATPAFKKAGVSLGTAFAHQFIQQSTDIIKQAGLIANGPQRPGTTGQNSKLVNPLAVLHKDQAAVAKLQREIGDKQIGLQTKISKESVKHTAYLKAIAAAAAGPGRTSKDRNPGKQSKTSKTLNNTTG